MKGRQRAPRYNQAAIRGPREGRDGTLDLADISYVDRGQLNAERRRGRLDRAELAGPGGYTGVSHDSYSRHTRCDLLEQLQPFAGQAVFVIEKTSNIAARSRQALDEACADGIGDIHEHDRHGAGRALQLSRGRGATGQDNVRRERDQFRRESANAVGIARTPAILDPHVAAVDPAQLLQSLLERREA